MHTGCVCRRSLVTCAKKTTTRRKKYITIIRSVYRYRLTCRRLSEFCSERCRSPYLMTERTPKKIKIIERLNESTRNIYESQYCSD